LLRSSRSRLSSTPTRQWQPAGWLRQADPRWERGLRRSVRLSEVQIRRTRCRNRPRRSVGTARLAVPRPSRCSNSRRTSASDPVSVKVVEATRAMESTAGPEDTPAARSAVAAVATLAARSTVVALERTVAGEEASTHAWSFLTQRGLACCSTPRRGRCRQDCLCCPSTATKGSGRARLHWTFVCRAEEGTASSSSRTARRRRA
jgi:hypothetical protein